MVNTQKDYTTSEVAIQLELPESTVRYYAQEFDNYLQIPRNKAGYRIFQAGHIDSLQQIKILLKDEGLSIKQVHQHLESPMTNQGSKSYPMQVTGRPTSTDLEQVITAMDTQNAERIADLEQAILMLAPLLRQIRDEQASKLDAQSKELEHILDEMKELQNQLKQQHASQTMTAEESIRRTDELITAWRDQQKANQEVAAAVQVLQSTNSRGFFARLFGF